MATRLALGERKKRVSLEITTTPRFAGASTNTASGQERNPCQPFLSSLQCGEFCF